MTAPPIAKLATLEPDFVKSTSFHTLPFVARPAVVVSYGPATAGGGGPPVWFALADQLSPKT